METLSLNWWAVVLRGLWAVLFGIVLLVWPGISLVVLVLIFGAFAIVDGIFSLISAFRRSRADERWGPLVFVGITGILAGLAAWFWPGITAIALTFLVGAWAIVTGILSIFAAVDLRNFIRGEFWLGLAGALSILFGILIYLQPVTGAITLVLLIGIYALLLGGSLIGLGFRLRSLEHRREAHA